jgi:hypothetical protein
MGSNDKKRYMCSFVKRKGEEFLPNVVVIQASNNVAARAMLCLKYGVPNVTIDKRYRDRYTEEGVKDVRLCETNTYADGRDTGTDLDDNS